MKTVERGAELLDEINPGWEQEINLDRLSMSHSCNCVLGQLYGNFFGDGLDAVNLTEGQSSRYGFKRWPSGDWWNLTEAWRKLIRVRRGE